MRGFISPLHILTTLPSLAPYVLTTLPLLAPSVLAASFYISSPSPPPRSSPSGHALTLLCLCLWRSPFLPSCDDGYVLLTPGSASGPLSLAISLGGRYLSLCWQASPRRWFKEQIHLHFNLWFLVDYTFLKDLQVWAKFFVFHFFPLYLPHF